MRITLLVLGLLSTLVALAWAALITLGNMMSDSPGTQMSYRSIVIPVGLALLFFVVRHFVS